MQGRTTFLIAHRLSTLEGCDVRLEMVEGRLIGNTSGGPQATALPLVEDYHGSA